MKYLLIYAFLSVPYESIRYETFAEIFDQAECRVEAAETSQRMREWAILMQGRLKYEVKVKGLCVPLNDRTRRDLRDALSATISLNEWEPSGPAQP